MYLSFNYSNIVTIFIFILFASMGLKIIDPTDYNKRVVFLNVQL